jgi:hypothetical protein
MWVPVVGEAAIGVAFARGRDELEAHAGSTGAAAIGEEVVGGYCGKAARPAVDAAAAAVVGVGVVVAAAVVTGESTQISGKRPEAPPRVW